jgi:large-conductance mechanosensitive channel
MIEKLSLFFPADRNNPTDEKFFINISWVVSICWGLFIERKIKFIWYYFTIYIFVKSSKKISPSVKRTEGLILNYQD